MALGVFLATLAVAGCNSPRPAASTAQLLPSTPTQLPTFDLASFEKLLAQLEGRPVVVNIWASWCGPCEVEAPDLSRAAVAYRGRVQFVGVDILDELAPAREFIRRHRWIYPSVFDPTGAIRDGLGYVGQPITIVFDRSGNKTFEWSGAITMDRLTEEVAKVV